MSSQDSERHDSSDKGEVNANNNATSNTMPPYQIGGPNTSLPFFAESFLGWSLCLSCLAVSGYHYGKSIVLSSGRYFNIHRMTGGIMHGIIGRWNRRSLVYSPSNNRNSEQLQSNSHLHLDDGNEATWTWIPLTTHSRAELDNHSPWERYLNLLRLFEKCHPEVLTPSIPIVGGNLKRELDESGSMAERTPSNMDDILHLKYEADAALIRVLRRDRICRRLASLAMRPYNATKFAAPSAATVNVTYSRDESAHTTTLLRQLPHNELLQRMSKLWNHFLVLPSLEEAKSFYRLPTLSATPVAAAKNKAHENDAKYSYRISLIVPAYHEKGSHIFKKLRRALEMAEDPNEVEVVIVDAGGCGDLKLPQSLTGDANCDKIEDGSNTQYWGRVAIFSFVSGGGRGPCLNFGASVATGRILTFCHSDTALPRGWDKRIMNTLERDSMDDELSRSSIGRANSCAFSFGIDTSRDGLSMPFESSTKTYYPPGIRAVEITANLRCRFYSLPYGDQVLSLHACVFEFLGGYPDQCLMEDYELVSLLRRRASLFVPSSGAPGRLVKERLAIIPGSPALCSPRRWQKFGVLYVTFMNSKFVNLYAGSRKIGPDELFQLYYGRKPPERDINISPWEVELADILEE